ncbi:MAG: glycosyltransferase [Pyrinomonadaceae bacterium]|nr:glycosyltransferase [Acidobacteriota bacterium]MBK7932727.1 glycosyltransferase [Acidobacteriota bacterium]MBP7374944.1 glycosyltransferase [Pyrinomonadaceae bacterium]
MKIFFPLQVFYPSQAGGPANSVYWLTKYLKRSGVDPVILATDQGVPPDLALNKWSENEEGRVMHVRTAITYFPLHQTLRALRCVAAADVVQVSSIFFPAAFFSALFARLLGKKLVVSPRDELAPYGLTRSTARKRPILWFYRTFLARYASFHATAEKEVVDIENYFGQGIRVVHIPNLIEMPALMERSASGYLLFIGRIDPKKGIDKLIMAASRSLEFRNSNIILKIAGNGGVSYVTELRGLAETLGLADRVEFLGQVEGEAKQQLLADASWTFMPSISENFGVVVLESLAQNTPVIASTGTPWSILQDEKVGYWIDNDADSLASVIDTILTMTADEYNGYRGRSRKFVEEHFEINKIGGKWLDLYKSL